MNRVERFNDPDSRERMALEDLPGYLRNHEAVVATAVRAVLHRAEHCFDTAAAGRESLAACLLGLGLG